MLCSTRTIHILIYLSWYLLSCLRQFLQCVTVSILSVFLRQKSIVLWSHLTTWCLGVNAIIDLCTFFSHRLYFILLAKLTSINKQLIFVKISSVLIDQTYNPLMLYVVYVLRSQDVCLVFFRLDQPKKKQPSKLT